MKKGLIAILIGVGFASCTQVAGWFGSENKSEAKAAPDSSMSVQFARDESITTANAYSDLFLDSALVDSFIVKEKLSDTAAQSLRNFYKVRNYQYAWFSSTGTTEQGRGFWGLQGSDYKVKDTSLKAHMDTVIQKDSLMIQSGDTAFVQTELRMTKEFFEFARKNGDGMINADNIYFVVPAKKMAPMELADSILHKQRDSAFYARHNEYMALKKGLALYYQAAKNGGWQPLPAAQRLARGTKSPAVVALKKRLSATGDYSAADTTNVFSDSLVAAIKDYQLRHGLLASGQVNDSLISALNVPAEERVQQILVNLNRVLWMQPLNDSSRIIVNIPSYTLYAYSDSGKAMEMPIIAGKQGTSTVMFTDEISQLVFAPYWRLPQSIVRNEIMPKLQQDPNYLKKRNMEIVKQNDSLPEIRQLPGKDNALGKVKFLFPNSFDIYLHDTPDKSLFAQKNRALSHGCIRVADPLSLAQFILGDQGDWTKEKIMQAMNSDKEQTVAVKKKVPVQINYYTAWSDNNGRIHFRNDVYGHDQVTKQRMFSNSGQTTGSVAQR